MNLHYQSWEHHSPPFSTSNRRIGGSGQPSIPPISQRSARNSSDMPRSGTFMHQFIADHKYSPKYKHQTEWFCYFSADNFKCCISTVLILEQQVLLLLHLSLITLVAMPKLVVEFKLSRHTINTTILAHYQHYGHGHGHVGPVASSSDHIGGLYFIPSDTLGGRNFQEPENLMSSQFHGWERNHLSSFSLSQVERDLGWGAFHEAATSGSNPGCSFRQRLGSERPHSQSRS
ncbi:hypothetical protein CXB51_011384 [Gossypium anomalum]|uniref:Uncharacterized protein n=1 Tax=Gossypium anomalum TaxID=47600 RepID=A0A8J5Z4W5_9ROSI|nr:hypothetical protein CXB51_011384 [Gossypium anomalum]